MPRSSRSPSKAEIVGFSYIVLNKWSSHDALDLPEPLGGALGTSPEAKMEIFL